MVSDSVFRCRTWSTMTDISFSTSKTGSRAFVGRRKLPDMLLALLAALFVALPAFLVGAHPVEAVGGVVDPVDCTTGVGFAQLLVDPDGANSETYAIKKYDIDTQSFVDLAVPVSVDLNAAYGIVSANASFISPETNYAYSLVRHSNGNDYLVRFDMELDLEFLAQIDWWTVAATFGPGGSMVYPRSGALRSLANVDSYQGFSDVNDPGLPVLVEADDTTVISSNTGVGAGNDVAQVVVDGQTVYIMKKSSALTFPVSEDLGGVVLQQSYTATFYAYGANSPMTQAELDAMGLAGDGWGAAWSIDGAAYFSSNSGHGLFKVRPEDVNPATNTIVVHQVIAGNADFANSNNDGFSCDSDPVTDEVAAPTLPGALTCSSAGLFVIYPAVSGSNTLLTYRGSSDSWVNAGLSLTVDDPSWGLPAVARDWYMDATATDQSTGETFGFITNGADGSYLVQFDLDGHIGFIASTVDNVRGAVMYDGVLYYTVDDGSGGSVMYEVRNVGSAVQYGSVAEVNDMASVFPGSSSTSGLPLVNDLALLELSDGSTILATFTGRGFGTASTVFLGYATDGSGSFFTAAPQVDGYGSSWTSSDSYVSHALSAGGSAFFGRWDGNGMFSVASGTVSWGDAAVSSVRTHSFLSIGAFDGFGCASLSAAPSVINFSLQATTVCNTDYSGSWSATVDNSGSNRDISLTVSVAGDQVLSSSVSAGATASPDGAISNDDAFLVTARFAGADVTRTYSATFTDCVDPNPAPEPEPEPAPAPAPAPAPDPAPAPAPDPAVYSPLASLSTVCSSAPDGTWAATVDNTSSVRVDVVASVAVDGVEVSSVAAAAGESKSLNGSLSEGQKAVIVVSASGYANVVAEASLSGCVPSLAATPSDGTVAPFPEMLRLPATGRSFMPVFAAAFVLLFVGGSLMAVARGKGSG